MERQRAQAARDLTDYYNQFSRDDTSHLDVLKKEGRDGRRQVAIILRRLNTVAREVDLPSADKVRPHFTIAWKRPTLSQTRERIDKYCEKFEKDMLSLFDRCYRKGDPKMMHVCLARSCPGQSAALTDFLLFPQHCAQTLLEFNGGASCVQVYVNQHDFFINRVRETKKIDDAAMSVPPFRVYRCELIIISDGKHYQIQMRCPPKPNQVSSIYLQRFG
jgi:hypothetical protein